MRAIISGLATTALLGTLAQAAQAQPSPREALGPPPDPLCTPRDPLCTPRDPLCTPRDPLCTPHDAPCAARCACAARSDDDDALARYAAEEAHETLAAAIAMFIPAWSGSTLYAWTLRHSVAVVDALPVVGALAAAARPGNHANIPGLLFAGGVQTLGLVLVAISAVELARVSVHRHELAVSVAAAPGTIAASLRMPW